MSLKSYQSKRKFLKTPEPKGKVVNSKKSLIFVVHRNEASHLHWDLRLEMDGVLKSWAIPKEPPIDKNVKRLAVQVEYHPIEYSKFKGIIPEGNYGAGKVEIWDKGKYVLENKKPNKIVFELKGKKLKGRYVLVKTNYGKNNWLWFKI